MKKGLMHLMLLVSLLFSFPVTSSAYGNAETVYVYKVLDNDYKAVVVRANGEAHLIEYGVGVISMWMHEGRTAIINSPGLFAGVGSSIILPDESQTAIIWDDKYLGNVNQ